MAIMVGAFSLDEARPWLGMKPDTEPTSVQLASQRQFYIQQSPMTFGWISRGVILQLPSSVHFVQSRSRSDLLVSLSQKISAWT